MTQHPTFSLHASSTVLTPDVPGLGVLVDCLRERCGFMARQSTLPPITPSHDAQQWVLCTTSGTSGQPKIIRRNPLSWTQSFAITADHFGVGSDDIYATFGSLGHSLSLYASVEALCLGADICGLARISPKRQALEIAAMGVTVIYATPTQLRLWLKGAAQAQITSFPKLCFVFCGGGALSEKVKSAVHAICPQAQIITFFGASETSFMTIADSQTPVGSVGRAYPDVQMRIDAPQGEVGEIWVASPYLFDGYASGDHEDTQWDGPFLSIGEMGHLDAQGNLFLRGRKNRMITVADVNVFPEDIERCVSQLESVHDCAVVSEPDETRGNRLICFVAYHGAPLLPAEVQAHCRETLGQYCVPKEVRAIAQMPLLAAGKPDLARLRTMAVAG
ncbi:AMP-binding protein [Loktanella sp. D2R18]|uniref:class I adenylate-forming enzyme family protein n=1 Tax=Rhodobacterales TaxID=204455 RepID=UPI000DEB98DD|nr:MULTISPECIES: AMP-binding protein [Rhodobacterales]MDO6591345.1 AMP-binding protein [Yoonia sp. 1_MG-2023]RBW46292.1 AMP-binding protein [Loktanella sp. D2R18]